MRGRAGVRGVLGLLGRVRGAVVAVGLVGTAGLVGLVGTGCSSDPTRGYALSSTYDRGVSTVSVPIFRNETFVTGLEFDLTDAVIKRIQAQTPWAVTASDRADTQLTGTITDVTYTTLSGSPGTGLIQEQALAVTVDFTWRDNRSGRVLVARERFRATSTFIASPGPGDTRGERPEIGQRDAVGELSEAIVSELRSSW